MTGLENVTRRSGNYKSFPVLVRMIVTALANRSDSVVIQFLTRTQLELLFKSNSGRRSNSANSAGTSTNNNRYFLIIYKAEFDHVKYPLPLIYTPPTVERLQEKLLQMREELHAERRRKSDGSAMEKLLAENDRLQNRIRILEQSMEQGPDGRLIERYKEE